MSRLNETSKNTLVIIHKTRLGIERAILPTPELVPIRFLEAKVGSVRNTCAVQLGSIKLVYTSSFEPWLSSKAAMQIIVLTSWC
ncbi:hypothetical protein F4782DRAFT_504614 [Xylaria castorea]|nr:hypothetical protein F4782DRAFT_504614 [Xylaria castorea]